MKPEVRELFAHMATALSRYMVELRRDGVAAPPELASVLVFLADCARTRQDATSVDDRRDPRHGAGMTDSSHLLLTKRDAASVLRISVRQLERVVAAGHLETVRIEGAVRLRRTDVEQYVSNLNGRRFRDQVEEKA